MYFVAYRGEREGEMKAIRRCPHVNKGTQKTRTENEEVQTARTMISIIFFFFRPAPTD